MPLSETGKYPFFIVPDVERYLQLEPDCEEAKKLAKKITVNIGDSETLKRILGDTPEESAPETEADGSSFDTINAFLDKFASDIKPTGYIPQISLAELIKSRRYNEALQFIEQQNLNNPQKSIYFAHQMRFIKKLIALDNYRNKNQG